MADWHFLYYSLHKFLPIIKCPEVSDASSSTWALEPTSASFPSLFWVVSLFLFNVRWSRSVVSNSLRPHGLLCPWGFPGKKTGVGCHFLLQEVFPTQGLNPGLPHCRRTLYHLSHQGSPSLYCILSIRHFELPLPQAHICLNHFSFSQSFFCSLPASSALFITLNYYLLVVKSFFFGHVSWLLGS